MLLLRQCKGYYLIIRLLNMKDYNELINCNSVAIASRVRFRGIDFNWFIVLVEQKYEAPLAENGLKMTHSLISTSPNCKGEAELGEYRDSTGIVHSTCANFRGGNVALAFSHGFYASSQK